MLTPNIINTKEKLLIEVKMKSFSILTFCLFFLSFFCLLSSILLFKELFLIKESKVDIWMCLMPLMFAIFFFMIFMWYYRGFVKLEITEKIIEITKSNCILSYKKVYHSENINEISAFEDKFLSNKNRLASVQINSRGLVLVYNGKRKIILQRLNEIDVNNIVNEISKKLKRF